MRDTETLENTAVKLHSAIAASLLAAFTLSATDASALSFTALDSGYDHSCGITDEARLMCWGDNGLGQLGTGPGRGSYWPVGVSGLSSVSAVAVSNYYSCAIAGGKIWCWGENHAGQLGTGDREMRPVPTEVHGPWGAGAFATAVSTGLEHACAIVEGGLWCWGDNGYGQIGDGSGSDRLTPVQIWPGNTAFDAVSLGDLHSCALNGGKLYCWGNNAHGELGDGSLLSRTTPTLTQGFPADVPVQLVDAGSQHACATAGGKAYCWGDNTYGQLGDDTVISRSIAAPVGGALAGVNSIESTGAGEFNSCAVAGNGATWCWGSNDAGQLGSGPALADSKTPVAVNGSHGRIQVGAWHVCATGSTGATCWGGNWFGQCGSAGNDILFWPQALDLDSLFRDGFQE